MPSRPLRPCKHPGCPELTRDGYCAKHKQDARAYERYRGSAAQRGYNDEWEAFRIDYLRRHPLCVDCMNADRARYTPAKEVHHIKKLRDHPELKYAESNLMALCHDCHSKRTARGE